MYFDSANPKTSALSVWLSSFSVFRVRDLAILNVYFSWKNQSHILIRVKDFQICLQKWPARCFKFWLTVRLNGFGPGHWFVTLACQQAIGQTNQPVRANWCVIAINHAPSCTYIPVDGAVKYLPKLCTAPDRLVLHHILYCMRFGHAHRWSGHSRAFHTSVPSLRTLLTPMADFIFPRKSPKDGIMHFSIQTIRRRLRTKLKHGRSWTRIVFQEGW